MGVLRRKREASTDARLDLIEALLREHQMHEELCPVRFVQVHNAQGQLSYIAERPCCCWLSEVDPDGG